MHLKSHSLLHFHAIDCFNSAQLLILELIRDKRLSHSVSVPLISQEDGKGREAKPEENAQFVSIKFLMKGFLMSLIKQTEKKMMSGLCSLQVKGWTVPLGE